MTMTWMIEHNLQYLSWVFSHILPAIHSAGALEDVVAAVNMCVDVVGVNS